MKLIPLTQGYFTKVDDEDYEELSKYKWCAHVEKGRPEIYAKRKVWVNKKAVDIRMHRQILNAPKGVTVDHEDHDGLNNQRYNIRLASTAQNQWNKKPYKGIKHAGVYKAGKTKWGAKISHKNKILYLGSFDTEQEAIVVRHKKAIELRGEFAYKPAEEDK